MSSNRLALSNMLFNWNHMVQFVKPGLLLFLLFLYSGSLLLLTIRSGIGLLLCLLCGLQFEG